MLRMYLYDRFRLLEIGFLLTAYYYWSARLDIKGTVDVRIDLMIRCLSLLFRTSCCERAERLSCSSHALVL